MATEVDEDVTAAPPSNPSDPPTDEDTTAVLKAAMKRNHEFFNALDIKVRPIAPFIQKPKLPRTVRQKVLDRLTGQHLAVAAALSVEKEDMTPEAAAKNKSFYATAIATAIDQEAELYSRCSSAQIYQNLAARTSALDWRVQCVDKKAEDAYGVLLETQRKHETTTMSSKKRRKIIANTSDTTSLQQQKQEKQQQQQQQQQQRVGALEDYDLFDQRQSDYGNDAAAESVARRKDIRRRVLHSLESVPKWTELSAEERVEVVDRCTAKVVEQQGEEESFLKGQSDSASVEIDVDELQKLTRRCVDHYLSKKRDDA